MFSKKLIIAAFSLLASTQAFASSNYGEFPCYKVDEGIIAILRTPIRPFGMVRTEDIELVVARCALLGGELGQQLKVPPPPQGAASPVMPR